MLINTHFIHNMYRLCNQVPHNQGTHISYLGFQRLCVNSAYYVPRRYYQHYFLHNVQVLYSQSVKQISGKVLREGIHDRFRSTRLNITRKLPDSAKVLTARSAMSCLAFKSLQYVNTMKLVQGSYHSPGNKRAGISNKRYWGATWKTTQINLF